MAPSSRAKRDPSLSDGQVAHSPAGSYKHHYDKTDMEQPVNVLDSNSNRHHYAFKPSLVQEPDNIKKWLQNLPASSSSIEVRATTQEDLDARECEVADASSKNMPLQRRESNPKKGSEAVPCSDPRISDAWFCKSLELRDDEDSGKVYDPKIAGAVEIAEAWQDYKERLDHDVKQFHKNVQLKKVALILGLVVISMVAFALLTWLAVFLRRRSKKHAAARAEGRVDELQLQTLRGDARGDQAGKP